MWKVQPSDMSYLSGSLSWRRYSLWSIQIEINPPFKFIVLKGVEFLNIIYCCTVYFVVFPRSLLRFYKFFRWDIAMILTVRTIPEGTAAEA